MRPVDNFSLQIEERKNSSRNSTNFVGAIPLEPGSVWVNSSGLRFREDALTTPTLNTFYACACKHADNAFIAESIQIPRLIGFLSFAVFILEITTKNSSIIIKYVFEPLPVQKKTNPPAVRTRTTDVAEQNPRKTELRFQECDINK